MVVAVVVNSLSRAINRTRGCQCRLKARKCSSLRSSSLRVPVSFSMMDRRKGEVRGILLPKAAARIAAHPHALPTAEVSTHTLKTGQLRAPHPMLKRQQLDRRPGIA